MEIVDSLLSENTTARNGGGALANNLGATMTVRNSVLTDNAAIGVGVGAHGGAILNGGILTLTDSTLTRNTVTDVGGAGGGLSNVGTATIRNSTLSGNSAPRSGGGIMNWRDPDGGAILNVINSTLSGNRATGEGVGYGGGINNESNCTATFTNSTVTGNQANYGGGIISDGLLTLGNTLVAGNAAVIADQEIWVGESDWNSQGHNLIGQNGNPGMKIGGTEVSTLPPPDFTPPVGLAQILGPLTANGGPTQTHPLAVGSPALDAGNNALIPAGVTTDQRGVARIQNGTVDVGAVEEGSSGVVTHTVTPTAGPNGSIAPATPQTVIAGTTFTFTFTITPSAGYAIQTVTGCGGALTGATYTTAPITADCTITASFTTAPATTGGTNFSVMNHASRILAYTTGLNSLGQLGAGFTSSISTAQVQPQASFLRRLYPVRVSWFARRTSQSPAAAVMPLAADTPDFIAIAIATATAHTIALRGDGTVWAWGDNAKGQLGNGTTDPAYEPVPVLDNSSGTPTPLSGVIAIAAGRDHSVAVKSDGTVWTWGSNQYGQLGDNSFSSTQRDHPVQVLFGDAPNIWPLTGVKAVAASDVHTIALKTDGTVWSWGGNSAGQLGLGNTATRRTAARVLVLNDVQAITARGASSSLDSSASPRNLAQRSDGSLWGWGDNTYCELGETTTDLGSAVSTPVRLANLSNLGVSVSDIAQGDYHGIARKSDGAAWTWGRNHQGQLGDGTTEPRCAPIQVPGVSAVETVGAGATHTFVTTRDGWVWGWGSNDEGQLGVGDTNARLKPTQMKGETGEGSFLNLKVEPTALPGDVNGDGNVDALDVVAVINAVLGIQPSPTADVNNDGNVNALDVVFVINEVLGL